ncbi:MAG: iron ABC transporter permease, partial [Enterobacterales bacterium]|nr:iron ABC transporter permease [Enterobacterales bacterium]
MNVNTIEETSSRSFRFGGPSWLTLSALGLALILAIPVFGIIWSIFQPGEGNWPHLVETVLPQYIQNSLILMLGVGLGVSVLGVGCAWLVVMCRFPGRRLFEWALILPLAVPAYVVAYAYTDVLQASGPLQSMIRDSFDLRFGEYWFPQVRSIEGAIVIFTAVLYPYVYLLARAAFLEQSVCALDAARTLGRSAWGAFRCVALPLA